MDNWRLPSGIPGWRKRCAGRFGFTLFEVGISLLIVSFAVVSVMMVFPVGLRQQQMVRYQILASTRALQLVDAFASRSSVERVADFEVPRPWEGSAFCYSSTRWDLETLMTRWDSGVIPLPREIARRLESDGNEIQNILDAGGMLYYADPGSVPSIDYRYHNPAPPNEAQRLVFAVAGYAQHNAITTFPYKAWPYRAAYPSPPSYMCFSGHQYPPKELHQHSFDFTVDLVEGWCNGDPGNGLFPTLDPKMIAVFDAFATYWSKPNAIGAAKTGDQASTALVKAALAYCSDKFTQGVITGVSSMSGMAPADEYARFITVSPAQDYQSLGQEYDDQFAALCRRAELAPTKQGDLNGLVATKARMRAEIALRVQCFRFLAMALGTFNQWSSQGMGSGGKNTGSSVGVRPDLASIPPVDGLVISAKLLQYFHERSLATVMRYSASFPYDWGAPRPLNRAIMMDQPLFEFDLFTPPQTGFIGATAQVPAAMWRPICAQALTSPGLPSQYRGAMVGNTWRNDATPFPAWSDRGPNQLWGDPKHFTLTRAFDAYERCRQIVFWSVDWRSYEDAETVPSAPIDASRAPIRCLYPNDGPGSYFYSQSADPTCGKGRCYRGKNSADDYDSFYLGNPERTLVYLDNISGFPTGAQMSAHLMSTVSSNVNNSLGAKYKDRVPEVFIGAYGADRNHNYQLDRGPISSTQRLRAISVARFNYYDPRIPIVIR